MSSYRSRPVVRPWHWVTLILVTATLMLFPVAVNAILPETPGQGTPVDLGETNQDLGWSMPLVDEAGTPILCKKDNSLPLIGGYDCGGTAVVPYTHEDGDDPDRTLRRMMRASAGFENYDAYPITKHGRLRIMKVDGTWPATGLSIQGSGDHEGYSTFVFVEGDEEDRFVELVTRALLNGAPVIDAQAEQYSAA